MLTSFMDALSSELRSSEQLFGTLRCRREGASTPSALFDRCRNFCTFSDHQVSRAVHAATPVIMAMISFLSVLAVSLMPIC